MGKKISLYNEKSSLFIFYLLSIICMVSINVGNYSFSKISYIVIGVLSIFTTLETNIILFFCLVPFPRIILLNQSFFTLIPIIELIIVCKWLVLKQFNQRDYKALLSGACILIYSSLVEYIRYATFSNSVEYCLKLFVILAICDVTNKKLAKNCFGFLSLSSIISIIASYIFPTLSVYVRIKEVLYSTRINGLLGDPGEFGQLLLSALSCYIVYCVLRNESNKRKFTILDVLSILVVACISIYLMIQSGTRTCLIGLVIIYVFILLWLLKGKSRKTVSLGCIALIVTLFMGYYIWEIMFDTFMSSHGGESLNDDNRIRIWLNYLREFNDDIRIQIFGVGMDCSNTYGLIHKLGNPHNILIEKIFECGLVGLILNCTFFVNVFKRKKCSVFEKANLPFYVFLSTLFFYGSVGIELLYFLIGLLPSKNNNSDDKANINLHNIRGNNGKGYS